MVDVVEEKWRSDLGGRSNDLLDFGGMRICMADFGWRASFGESAEEVWAEKGTARGGTGQRAEGGRLSTTQNPGG